jgi:SagB-type dehydrogenase family enzyme
MAARGAVKGSPRLYRRAPCLVSYWREGQAFVENYAHHTGISADGTTLQILDFFDIWRSVDSLAAYLPEYDRRSLDATVKKLFAYAFLMRADQPVDQPTKAFEQWSRWNPAAGYFHVATKDVPFDDAARVNEYLSSKASRTHIPKSVKRYRGAEVFQLAMPRLTGEFPQVLLARRTWRRFSSKPIPVHALSTLLALTYKIQGSVAGPGNVRLPLKTSPSGGARHSIEAYVLVRNVSDVAKGLYHYAADQHALELLRSGLARRDVRKYLPNQPGFESAAALVLMTSVFERVQWKYEFGRAYRVILAEAGHLCQTFCLTATWLGLAPFCTMALADSVIERDLRIDGIKESVLYVAGIGARPKGGKVHGGRDVRLLNL